MEPGSGKRRRLANCSCVDDDHHHHQGLSLADFLEDDDHCSEIVPARDLYIAEGDFMELDDLYIEFVSSRSSNSKKSPSAISNRFEVIDMPVNESGLESTVDFLELKDIMGHPQLVSDASEYSLLELSDIVGHACLISEEFPDWISALPDENGMCNSGEQVLSPARGNFLLYAQGDFLELDDLPTILPSTKMRVEIAEDDFLEMEDIMGRGFVYNRISASISTKLNHNQSGKEEVMVPQLYCFSTFCPWLNLLLVPLLHQPLGVHLLRLFGVQL